MILSAEGRLIIETHIALTAKHYGGTPGHEYAATPSIAQALNAKIVLDGNWLLPLINVISVSEIAGEKVLMGLSGPVTSRTDTSGAGERAAKSFVSLSNQPYTLVKTETDIAIKYAMIDAWAKFPNFAAMYGQLVSQAIGNDRVRVGWLGTSAAVASNIVANPNLEDINKGWLQLIREYNAGSQYTLGTVPAPVQLGSVTFPNLDALAYSARNKLAVQYREDPDLVVLLGRNVVQYAEGKYYSLNGNTPTEKAKIAEKMLMSTYGGMPAIVPPFFPANGLLVTSLKNLSIYWQDKSWRRNQMDESKKDQYSDYNSRNEGYVVEIEDKTAFIDNITYA